MNVLWFAFFAGPVAWTLHESVSYALVKPACGSGAVVLEHIVTLAALALPVAGAYVASRVGGLRVPRTTPEFVSVSALVLNGLFAFAILLEALPELVVSPCL